MVAFMIGEIYMVRLAKEIAVIGAIRELLYERQEAELPDVPNFCLSLNTATVFEYSRQLEALSGYAIINDFSGSTLDRFFLEYDQLFQYDPYQSIQEDDKVYRVRLDALLPSSVQAGMLLPELELDQINKLVNRLFRVFEPSVNYPFDLLQKMQLMDALTGEGWNE